MKKYTFKILITSFFIFVPTTAFGMCTTYTVPMKFQYEFINRVNTNKIDSSDISIIKDSTMWEKNVRIAKDKNSRVVDGDVSYRLKWWYIVDRDSCDVLYVETNKDAKKTIIKNIWKEPAGSIGGPEFIDIFKNEDEKYHIIFFSINKNFERKNIDDLYVNSDELPSLKIKNRDVRINGEKYVVAQLKRGKGVLKRDDYGFFLNIGDYGEPSTHRATVASAMAALSKKYNGIEKVITNGDNFYAPNGIQSVDDPDYKTNFEDFYVRDWLRVPFLISLGNHDYSDNNLSALLALDKKHTKWYLPNNYYSYSYPLHTDTPLVQFFMLDTNMISEGLPGTNQQLAWLNTELKNSHAQWKIVVGHHPPYSYGEHGNNFVMQEKVVPLLRTYHVDALINGHEHDMQLLNHPDDDITYVINGAASTLRATSSGPLTEFATSQYGFVALKIYKKTLTIFFYDENGNVLQKKILRK